MADQQGLSPFDWMGGNPEDQQHNEQMIAEAIEAQMEFARLVFDVCQISDRGPEFMERLRGLTIEQPLFKTSGAVSDTEITLTPNDWMCFREGQNSMVRFLEAQIHLAKNPPNMTKEGS